ncbi:prepilin-type N-terminal cleavage/methylation domain-containing protein [Leptolyngbya iicbica]|uniref:Prepilin-type N-terminal cleavage/methylation domain-containing protein n=2 Tax=Cyanophyceae TaxID=3028117 RepID=A0A4V2E3F0_9CYAN|nr:prepilin-type N-terminal cleavage/methylation domain-containing protein [Leptolyngbya sp. LK]RZM82210.1 prepilin-type N-terminal cleavage/methylation domain-containing protein [Leptolyngbya sp. LK]
MRRHYGQSGFTLIELLVVIIIIGVLAAITLPSFLNQANRARSTEAEIFLGAWLREQQADYLEQGEFSDDAGELDAGLNNFRILVNPFTNHQTAAGLNVSGLRIRALPTKPSLKQFMGKVWYDPDSSRVDFVICDDEGTNAFMDSKTYCPN